MALATVADVEVALGVAAGSLTPTKAAQVQYFIDTISAYVLEETGVNFDQTTDTVRMQADSFGELRMTNYEPVIAVNTITDYRTGEALSAAAGTGPQIYYYDGINTVYGLYPRQVVDLNLTYGYASVPASIKGVVVDASRRAYEAPKANLRERQVADVLEAYGPQDGSVYLSDHEKDILAGWSDTETSWALGIRPDFRDPREDWRDGYWPNGPYL